jgi:hypothetical protein
MAYNIADSRSVTNALWSLHENSIQIVTDALKRSEKVGGFC